MLRPEQAQDLVDHFGGKAQAARAIGVARGTLRYWLDPEKQCERMRERYWNLSGFEYNRLLLRHRRNKALERMTARNQRREANNGHRNHQASRP
jgi:hypothetical protein